MLKFKQLSSFEENILRACSVYYVLASSQKPTSKFNAKTYIERIQKIVNSSSTGAYLYPKKLAKNKGGEKGWRRESQVANIGIRNCSDRVKICPPEDNSHAQNFRLDWQSQSSLKTRVKQRFPLSVQTR